MAIGQEQGEDAFHTDQIWTPPCCIFLIVVADSLCPLAISNNFVTLNRTLISLNFVILGPYFDINMETFVNSNRSSYDDSGLL